MMLFPLAVMPLSIICLCLLQKIDVRREACFYMVLGFMSALPAVIFIAFMNIIGFMPNWNNNILIGFYFWLADFALPGLLAYVFFSLLRRFNLAGNTTTVVFFFLTFFMTLLLPRILYHHNYYSFYELIYLPLIYLGLAFVVSSFFIGSNSTFNLLFMALIFVLTLSPALVAFFTMINHSFYAFAALIINLLLFAAIWYLRRPTVKR